MNMGLLFSVKTGVIVRPLVVRLSRSDGSAVDLNGATGILRMRAVGEEEFTIEAGVVALDDTLKTATYDWQEEDVDTPGDYLGEIVLNPGTADEEIFPDTDDKGIPQYIKITIAHHLVTTP